MKVLIPGREPDTENSLLLSQLGLACIFIHADVETSSRHCSHIPFNVSKQQRRSETWN